MVNDTNTLNGALNELGETLATNLTTKGVTGANANDGLTTLANKILTIPGGASNVVQGSFTTANTGNTTGTVSLDYNGNGYPIALMVFISGGAYNNTENGNTDWYNSKNRYDVGFVTITKARITTPPTYSSGPDNYGVVEIVYKNSTTTATTYTRNGGMNIDIYVSSSSNATTSNSCVRFKGNGKTLSYYIGNRTSSTVGLARNTTFDYIVIYTT